MLVAPPVGSGVRARIKCLPFVCHPELETRPLSDLDGVAPG